MGVQLSLEWEGRTAKDFARVFASAAAITNFRGVLGIIAEQVVSPSIAANFNAGGRPKWAELAESTVRRKSAAGYANPSKILVATGAMQQAASDVKGYFLTDDTLVAGPFATTYWTYHQRGDGLPQRIIMMLQAADRTKINTIFANFLRAQMTFDPRLPGARQFTGGRRF